MKKVNKVIFVSSLMILAANIVLVCGFNQCQTPPFIRNIFNIYCGVMSAGCLVSAVISMMRMKKER